MRRGQDHAGSARPREDVGLDGAPDPTAPAISPAAGVCIPPSPIAEMEDHPPVRPLAALTTPLRATEPDGHRELWPVDRVEEAMLAPDGHVRRTATPMVNNA